MKIAVKTMSTLLLVVMLTLAFNLRTSQASPETILYIDPPSIIDPSLTPGSSFTVDLMVHDVVDCYSWQVYITWDLAVLNVSADYLPPPYDVWVPRITFGDFMAGQPGGTSKMMKANFTEGWFMFAECTSGEYPGVVGSGWLATVEFTVYGVGDSVLDIASSYWLGGPPHPTTYLLNSSLNFIPMTPENGYFNNMRPLDIDPNTLNLRSQGRWITAYIELSEDFNVMDIDVSSIMLNDTFSVDPAASTQIGDYDSDSVSDLMVKFNRTELTSYIYNVLGVKLGNITLTISGQLNDGTPFEGTDTIRAILGRHH